MTTIFEPWAWVIPVVAQDPNYLGRGESSVLAAVGRPRRPLLCLFYVRNGRWPGCKQWNASPSLGPAGLYSSTNQGQQRWKSTIGTYSHALFDDASSDNEVLGSRTCGLSQVADRTAASAKAMLLQRVLAVCVLFGGIASAGASARAQSAERSAIVGRVSDATDAPLRAWQSRRRVQALIGGARPIETDDAGNYGLTDSLPARQIRLAFLDSRLQFNMTSGSTPSRRWSSTSASCSPDRRKPCSFEGSPPVVDVTSAESPYRFSNELMSSLPTNRVLSDVMNLAPGVNAGIGLGGVQGSNPTFVEGVNTAEAAFLHPMASFNYNWVDDVQVIGVGAGAEYGEFSGVLQKSRLRSGGNRFPAWSSTGRSRPSWVGTNTSSLTPYVVDFRGAVSADADLAGHQRAARRAGSRGSALVLRGPAAVKSMTSCPRSSPGRDDR